MSFLRHQEIYQVSIRNFGNDLFNERARPSDHALTHRLDESPIGYSWRVALQQSPLLLGVDRLKISSFKQILKTYHRGKNKNYVCRLLLCHCKPIAQVSLQRLHFHRNV